MNNFREVTAGPPDFRPLDSYFWCAARHPQAESMWVAKLFSKEGEYLSDVECQAWTLLQAALILSHQLKDGQFIRDLCHRGWITTEAQRSPKPTTSDDLLERGVEE